MTTRGKVVVAVMIVCLGGLAIAQDEEIPLSNWGAPPYWNPAVQQRVEGEPGGGMTVHARGMQAQAGALPSSQLPLVAIAPCRIVDTRVAVSDGFHQPNFADNETRTFNLPGSTDCTGLPSNSGAWSLNVQFRPMTQPSFLTAFPTGLPMPLVSTMTAGPAAWVQNAAIVPAGTGGAIDIYCQYAARVVIDINGYYAPFLPYYGSASTPTGTDVFTIENTGNGRAMHAIASVDTALWARSAGGIGADGWSDSNTGVFGHSTTGVGVDGLSASNTGVYGRSTSGPGVIGSSSTNTGVWGISTDGIGVDGWSGSNTGVFGHSTSGWGVDGESDSSTGVFGHSASGWGVDGFSDTSTGVFGHSNSGLGMEALSITNTGLWGHSTSGRGVHGTSTSADGVVGATDATDQVAAGVRGTSTASFGVVGTSTSWTGVYGASTSGPGVHGQSTDGDGVLAEASADAKSGIFALNTNPNGYAGFFNGHVRVASGIFSVASLGPGPVCADAVGALVNCTPVPILSNLDSRGYGTLDHARPAVSLADIVKAQQREIEALKEALADRDRKLERRLAALERSKR